MAPPPRPSFFGPADTQLITLALGWAGRRKTEHSSLWDGCCWTRMVSPPSSSSFWVDDAPITVAFGMVVAGPDGCLLQAHHESVLVTTTPITVAFGKVVAGPERCLLHTHHESGLATTTPITIAFGMVVGGPQRCLSNNVIWGWAANTYTTRWPMQESITICFINGTPSRWME